MADPIELTDVQVADTDLDGLAAQGTDTGASGWQPDSFARRRSSVEDVKQGAFAGVESFDAEGSSAAQQKTRSWTVRLIICAIAVGLLWGTSLTVAESIAKNYITAPSLDEVWEKWEIVMEVISEEEAAATLCMNSNVDLCNNELNETSAEMAEFSDYNAQINDLLVLNAEIEGNYALIQWDEVLTAMLNYVTGLKSETTYAACPDIECIGIAITDNETCTFEEQGIISDWFLSGAEVTSSIYLVDADYVAIQTDLYYRAVASAEARIDYDEAYFDNTTAFLEELGFDVNSLTDLQLESLEADLDAMALNVTNPFLALQDCFNWTDATDCPEAQAFMESFEELQNDTAAYMEYVMNTFVNTVEDIEEYQINVEAKMDDYLALYDEMQPYATDINNLIPGFDLEIGFPTPYVEYPGAVPDLSGDIWEIPYFNLSAVEGFDTSEYTSEFEAQLAYANYLITTDAEAWAQAINDSLSNDLPPYNPPPLDASTSEYDTNSNEFLSESAALLGEWDYYELANDSEWLDASTYQFPENFDFLSEMDFHYASLGGTFDMGPIFDFMGYILDILVWTDVVWRVISTLRTVNRYLYGSAVNLPMIDVRDYTQKRRKPVMVFIAEVITHPVTIVLLISFVAVLGFSVALAVYIPLYESFQEGCVHSNNGTVFTQNANAVAFNYATQDSNEVMSRGLSEFDNSRIEVCGTYGESSQTTQNGFIRHMTAARSSTDKSAESLDIFTRCIDESAIPETNEGFLNYSISYDSPFLEDNYNDTLLYITLHTDNVIADKGWDYYDTWYVLEDGIFNCTHLPICTITCSGVDESAVKGSTHNAGCFTELMFHATIFRFLVAFSIYVCLNVSRHLMVMGLGRLNWQALTPDGFNFMGSVSKDGKLSTTVVDHLESKVADHVASWAAIGWVMIILSFVVHVPYIAVIVLYESS